MSTTPRPFRIPTELYDAARLKSQATGVTLTAVVVEALRRFVAGDSPPSG